VSRNESSQLVEYVVDALAPMGQVATRRFFSGTALLLDGLQFAFVARDTLYLRVDDNAREALHTLGGTPFRYSTRVKTIEIKSYYGAPAAVLDDVDELIEWAKRARMIALTVAASKALKAENRRSIKASSGKKASRQPVRDRKAAKKRRPAKPT
jgi:TfoX/Sxy family transcriptional regulator of competence genes